MEKTKPEAVMFKATKKKLDQDADGQWKLILEVSFIYGDAMREISKYTAINFDVVMAKEGELIKERKEIKEGGV